MSKIGISGESFKDLVPSVGSVSKDGRILWMLHWSNSYFPGTCQYWSSWCCSPLAELTLSLEIFSNPGTKAKAKYRIFFCGAQCQNGHLNNCGLDNLWLGELTKEKKNGKSGSKWLQKITLSQKLFNKNKNHHLSHLKIGNIFRLEFVQWWETKQIKTSWIINSYWERLNLV